jgi:signal transduction histidine kinase
MAAALQEREQRLIRSERMAAAGVLASHITHEVRNPLNSIALNTEMLEEEIAGLPGERGAEAGGLCRAIQAEVDRLTAITEEYLRFARLPKPSLQPQDVNDIVGSLASFIGGELESKRIRCRVELAERLPHVHADEGQLRQCLLNLLRNAAEAMEQSGGTITMRTTLEGNSVLVSVADDGPGIDAEHQAHIFDPFFTTRAGGTGLGLALTHQIVVEHGGAIDVQSKVGEGTVFSVALPIVSDRGKVGPSSCS